MKCVSFPWPPLEAALSVLNIRLFFVKKKTFIEKELMKIKEIAVSGES